MAQNFFHIKLDPAGSKNQAQIYCRGQVGGAKKHENVALGDLIASTVLNLTIIR